MRIFLHLSFCLALAAFAEIREHPGGRELPAEPYVRRVAESECPVERLVIKTKDGSDVSVALRRPKGGGPFPVLIFVHGWPGGRGMEQLAQWTLGADGSPVLEGFLQRGFVVIAADYRRDARTVAQALQPIPDDRASSLDDCLAVLDHVAALPYVDRNRITLYGSSLGGHLVARMAGRRKVHGAILGGAVLLGLLGAKAPDAAGTQKEAYRNLPIDAAMARRNVEAIRCPILLLVGADDFMADINRMFYSLLIDAHKPVRMEFYLHAYHGFETGPGAMAGPGKGKLPLLEGTLDALERAIEFAAAP
jgi:dienelactone hydrolase